MARKCRPRPKNYTARNTVARLQKALRETEAAFLCFFMVNAIVEIFSFVKLPRICKANPLRLLSFQLDRRMIALGLLEIGCLEGVLKIKNLS
jgi:hypothetical protein